jgi:hypothetical protein
MRFEIPMDESLVLGADDGVILSHYSQIGHPRRCSFFNSITSHTYAALDIEAQPTTQIMSIDARREDCRVDSDV